MAPRGLESSQVFPVNQAKSSSATFPSYPQNLWISLWIKWGQLLESGMTVGSGGACAGFAQVWLKWGEEGFLLW